MHKTDSTNHQKQATALAIRFARDKLTTGPGLSERCARTGLPVPATSNDAVRMPFFGKTLALQPPEFDGLLVETGKPPKPAEHLLALHYLASDFPVTPENRWITFREFPGGAFYWPAFLSRSIHPLLQSIGNDLGKLREHLARFSATLEAGPADIISARMVAVGRIEVLLMYRAGDEEFPPSADLLYDGCARRVYGAEDAAVLGGRVCFGLM